MSTPHYLLVATGADVDFSLMAIWAALGIRAFGGGAITHIVTDHPRRFAWLGDAVEVRAVDAATLRVWRGSKDFVLRIKLEAMRDTAASLEGAALVFIDSDVAARGELAGLHAELAAGRAGMHLFERTLGSLRSWRKRVLSQVDGRSWEGLSFSSASPMWNSGVVAIPGGDVEAVVGQALAALDAMHADGVEDFLLEQVVASAVMTGRYGELVTGDRWLAHYWGNKPGWVAAIARRVAEWQLTGTTVDDAVAELKAEPIALPTVVRYRRIHRLLPPWLLGDRLKTEYHKSF